jgi:hypothetical protein
MIIMYFNIKGLCNPTKKRALKMFLDPHQPRIIFIQEDGVGEGLIIQGELKKFMKGSEFVWVYQWIYKLVGGRIFSDYLTQKNGL